jgi:hypothetical protein
MQLEMVWHTMKKKLLKYKDKLTTGDQNGQTHWEKCQTNKNSTILTCNICIKLLTSKRTQKEDVIFKSNEKDKLIQIWSTFWKEESRDTKIEKRIKLSYGARCKR